MALDAAATQMRSIALPIAGMTCAGCAGRVERALAAAPGVVGAEVNLALETAQLRVAPDGPTPARLAEIVREAGFGVRLAETRLKIGGMTCAGCAGRVERALASQPGVISAEVNLALETATVRAAPGAFDAGALERAVAATGFSAEAIRDEAPPADEFGAQARRDMRMLAVAAALTAPFMVQMAAMATGAHWHMPVWLEVALAAPVQFWVGARFYRAAWSALKAGAGNMDQLVALGSSAAFFYSLWLAATQGAAAGGALYFEASAFIVTLVLAGKTLEARAKRSATEALRSLMALRPESATVLRAGKELEVAIAEVAIGDVVIVRPGARLPVDGRILRGETELDESLITGESMPVRRGPGEDAPAGALNGGGLIRLRAERVGRDSTLARIARMVAEAQSGKAPIQRLVDRVASVFVPVVLGVAAATFAGWTLAGAGAGAALEAAVAVLVVACPCALGLATPTALVAGTGAAARAGILIRDIEALERAAMIDAVLFDKTGTLTIGAPELVDLAGDPAALRLAASAQRGSEHPLGRATVAAAQARGLDLAEPEGFRATPGEGVEAVVEGRQVRVGRRRFVGGAADAALEAAAALLAEQGLTAVWIGVDGRPAAVAGFADAPRPDAAAAVAALKARGIDVRMLTGDAPETAARIAGKLGLAQVEAGLRPEDKLRLLRALRAEGKRVAMIGDGVNDAPALAAADVGVAMSGGADVAREAAGITLMRPRPSLVPAAFDIAAATARKIRQNLVWAFAYNVALIPAAALGHLSPALAAAAMACSSLSVVGNALLLKRWTPEGDSR
ncbi:MAG: heavy metal translocating P-type ATPase [Rubrimonas sp.]|uniref:heavy metal translocating P-type ATPase n=1 Tax=Rubrimonas sp. TaxID=2036015 RepID=UPI002FDCA775